MFTEDEEHIIKVFSKVFFITIFLGLIVYGMIWKHQHKPNYHKPGYNSHHLDADYKRK